MNRLDTRRRRALRQAVAARDGSSCWICDEPVDPDADRSSELRGSLDHVLEVRHGGTNDLDNLRLAHACCNVARDRNRMLLAPAPTAARGGRATLETLERVFGWRDPRYAWKFTVRPPVELAASDIDAAGQAQGSRLDGSGTRSR